MNVPFLDFSNATSEQKCIVTLIENVKSVEDEILNTLQQSKHHCHNTLMRLKFVEDTIQPLYSKLTYIRPEVLDLYDKVIDLQFKRHEKSLKHYINILESYVPNSVLTKLPKDLLTSKRLVSLLWSIKHDSKNVDNILYKCRLVIESNLITNEHVIEWLTDIMKPFFNHS